MQLRWGIVSAGKISNDFVCALQTLPKTDHKVIAVAARSIENAQKFAKDLEIPKAYEGYLSLAKDKDIDVIYIGNLNPQHFEVSKLMLEHGKHVLCEKPLTLNEKQTRELVEFAREKKLFLMEAIWSRCFPAYQELKKLLNGAIGDVLHLNVSFGFDLQSKERVTSKALGGGTVLDLGVYVLQLQQLVFNGVEPKETQVFGGLNSDGVDAWTTILWNYGDNKTSFMTTSGVAEYPNEALIIGTKGVIRIPKFWCPTSIITPKETLTFELPQSNAKYFCYNSVGLSYEAEHVRQCIQSGVLESPLVSHEDSIQLAHYMTSLRQTLGVVFEQD